MGNYARSAGPDLRTLLETTRASGLAVTWWPVLAGLAALYLPTWFDLSRTFWIPGRSSHGPVILALVAWLMWRERALFAAPQTASQDAPVSRRAVRLFAFGLFCYFVGRSQGVLQLEVLSQIPVGLALARLMLGREGVLRLAFPIAFSVFLVPVPGTLLDELLLPLKQLVSMIADVTLHAAGYPIARNGVMLMIGPYDLLIADACSGLNSMVALTGIGLIYIYVAGSRPAWRSALLLTSVLPIAFLANVVRVLVLLLVTYHLGDGASRAFHSWAAYLEMALAFASLFCIDRLTGRIAAHRSGVPRRAREPERMS